MQTMSLSKATSFAVLLILTKITMIIDYQTKSDLSTTINRNLLLYKDALVDTACEEDEHSLMSLLPSEIFSKSFVLKFIPMIYEDQMGKV